MNTSNEATIYTVPEDAFKSFESIDAVVCTRDYAIHCALALIRTDTLVYGQQDNKKSATGSLSAYLFNKVCKSETPVQALAEFRQAILESAKANGISIRYKTDKKGNATGELADPEALKSAFSMCRTITASPFRSTALQETGLRKAYDKARSLEQAQKIREASERAAQEQQAVAERQQREADQKAQQHAERISAAILSGEYTKTLAERIAEARKAHEIAIQAIKNEAEVLGILDDLNAELGEVFQEQEPFDAEGEQRIAA